MIHPNSVLSSLIEEFNEDLYLSLAEKENYCYTQSLVSNARVRYTPFFTSLNNNLVGFIQANRNSALIRSLTQSLYSYSSLAAVYEIDNVNISNYTAPKVFKPGNFISNTLSRSVDYYDDLVSVLDTETGTYYDRATRLENDISYLSSLLDLSAENSYIQSGIDQINNSTQKMINILMYNDPTPIGQGLGKDQLYDLIFIDFEYKNYLNLMGVSGVDPRS